ncbi:mothers against decapentaplegic homolog 6 [Cephus cinctus]|uniref:Mothers against decapentaplegic homolog n=1 Tax=Cephus cinctus TaxID=211228 RepID=A0AAJ7BMZ6_CEPCN|nr:mothers against decapentaplegic homolog 6 [Cephus cinctus]XP_024938371.1 mothers against decapentaplegic homolog 6 [Cephus cinctus]
MFMFWSKRTVLTRRLLKAKVRGEHETECETQEDHFFVANGNSTSQVRARASSSSSTSCTRVHHQAYQGRDNAEDPDRLLRCKELLKSLKENQLEMLLAAVESYGADLSSCVLVPRRHVLIPEDEEQYYYQEQHHQEQTHWPPSPPISPTSPTRRTQQQQRLSPTEERNPAKPVRDRCRGPRTLDSSPLLDPHLLSCQIWRWPDLAHSSELKRLPVCHSAKDPVYICCNPYHWSRLCKPESPPPPYCLIADRLRPEDRAPSEGDSRQCRNSSPLPFPGSLTTNGEGEVGQKEWCTLAYWELGGRVGRLYPVEPATVNVFDSLLDGDGLCLATLAENHTASPAVQRTRSKIGLGLMLSQESDGVWAYNRSESPIFVNSPTLDDPESRTLLVYRVPPGFCLNIFDRTKTLQLPYCGTTSQAPAFASGPVDVNSVRISFAKGWGPKYSRQEVTSCPCWLEVLLAPCR